LYRGNARAACPCPLEVYYGTIQEVTSPERRRLLSFEQSCELQSRSWYLALFCSFVIMSASERDNNELGLFGCDESFDRSTPNNKIGLQCDKLGELTHGSAAKSSLVQCAVAGQFDDPDDEDIEPPASTGQFDDSPDDAPPVRSSSQGSTKTPPSPSNSTGIPNQSISSFHNHSKGLSDHELTDQRLQVARSLLNHAPAMRHPISVGTHDVIFNGRSTTHPG